jgi:hypothetical protein
VNIFIGVTFFHKYLQQRDFFQDFKKSRIKKKNFGVRICSIEKPGHPKYKTKSLFLMGAVRKIVNKKNES